MQKLELVRKLQAHKGPIYVDVHNHNDTFWFKAVKDDLINQICEKFKLSTEETGFALDNEGFFGKDYLVR